MGKHFSFNKDQFNYLKERVESKFRKLAVEDNKSEYYGSGDGYDPYPIDDPKYRKGQGRKSLKYAMLQDAEVKKYIAYRSNKKFVAFIEADIEAFGKSFNGNNFAKKCYEIQQKKIIGIQEIDYGNVYLLYIGVCSFSESIQTDIYDKFLEDYEISKLQAFIGDDIDIIEAVEETKEKQLPKDPNKVIEYIAYYYSYIKHNIRDFDLEIDYNLNAKNKFNVKERRFHDNESLPEYDGYGYIAEQKLQIILKHIENKADKLNITLDSGKEPWRKDLMIGSIMGVSAQILSLTVSMEVVVLRKGSIDTVQLDMVKRYLFLNRKSFVIQDPPINISTLSYRQDLVRDLEYLVGHYRLWQFDENCSDIIESHFHIDAQFNAICRTKQYYVDAYDEQICLLKINDNHTTGRNIFVTTYSNEQAGMLKTNLIANIIFKPFKPFRKEAQELTKGILIVHGREENLLLKRAVIFQRVSNAASVQIGCHPIEYILKRVENDVSLKKMLDTLIEAETHDAKLVLDSYYGIKGKQIQKDKTGDFDSLAL